jgi:hypothetical protein
MGIAQGIGFTHSVFKAGLRMILPGMLVFGMGIHMSVRAQPPEGPAGIFVIGNTRAVAGEVAKFDLDFVSGYTLRVPWQDIESWDTATQAPRYDFSRMDSTLEELRARGKRMTLEIFINKTPDYVLALPGVVTWTNPHPTQGGVQVVPWDATALAAYQAMIQALANHVVVGTTWRVADHPTLQSVDASIVGLQGLRELSNTLVHHPDYTRERFTQGVVDAVAINRVAFAQKYGFLALFAMTDDTVSPALDEVVYARLMTEFNVSGKPSLGFFQETLSDLGPRPDALGLLLAAASPHTYILFQALRPWTLREGDAIPPEIASGTPVAGMEFSWANYGATYVELYGGDLLNTANTEGLRAWNRFLQSVAAVRGGRDTPTLESQPGGGMRLRWNADPLLHYRLWQSTDLASWSVVDTTEALDGDVPLPPSGETRRFFRTEILAPVR